MLLNHIQHSKLVTSNHFFIDIGTIFGAELMLTTFLMNSMSISRRCAYTF